MIRSQFGEKTISGMNRAVFDEIEISSNSTNSVVVNGNGGSSGQVLQKDSSNILQFQDFQLQNNSITGDKIDPNTTIGVANLNALTGNISANGTITAGGNFLSTLGNVVLGSGGFETTSGNILTISGNIGTTSGTINTTNGNITTTTGSISSGSGNIACNSGNISTSSGNISGVGITASGNISGVDITGSGNISGVGITASGNIVGANITGSSTITTAILRTNSITGKTDLTSDIVISNPISTGKNITLSGANTLTTTTGSIILGSGSIISVSSAGIILNTGSITTTSGDIATGSGNIATTSGNVSGVNIFCSGNINAIGNITGVDITGSGNISGVGITASGNISGVGITASGNIVGANITGTGTIGATNITANNLTISGTTSFTEIGDVKHTSPSTLSADLYCILFWNYSAEVEEQKFGTRYFHYPNISNSFIPNSACVDNSQHFVWEGETYNPASMGIFRKGTGTGNSGSFALGAEDDNSGGYLPFFSNNDSGNAYLYSVYYSRPLPQAKFFDREKLIFSFDYIMGSGSNGGFDITGETYYAVYLAWDNGTSTDQEIKSQNSGTTGFMAIADQTDLEAGTTTGDYWIRLIGKPDQSTSVSRKNIDIFDELSATGSTNFKNAKRFALISLLPNLNVGGSSRATYKPIAMSNFAFFAPEYAKNRVSCIGYDKGGDITNFGRINKADLQLSGSGIYSCNKLGLEYSNGYFYQSLDLNNFKPNNSGIQRDIPITSAETGNAFGVPQTISLVGILGGSLATYFLYSFVVPAGFEIEGYKVNLSVGIDQFDENTGWDNEYQFDTRNNSNKYDANFYTNCIVESGLRKQYITQMTDNKGQIARVFSTQSESSYIKNLVGSLTSAFSIHGYNYEVPIRKTGYTIDFDAPSSLTTTGTIALIRPLSSNLTPDGIVKFNATDNNSQIEKLRTPANTGFNFLGIGNTTTNKIYDNAGGTATSNRHTIICKSSTGFVGGNSGRTITGGYIKYRYVDREFN